MDYIRPEQRNVMITTAQRIKVQNTERSRLSGIDLANVKFGRTFSDHMFAMDYRDGAWQEARIVPFGDLSMSPATLVLHYAQTIFEGQKAYRTADGKVNIFRPMDNIRRMNRSADRMCMPPVPEDLFLEAMTTLVRMDAGWIPTDDEGAMYIRPFMYASDAFIGVRTSETYRFMIITCPVRGYYAEAVKVKIETHYSRAFPGGTGEAKCGGNYAASLYPAKQAHDKGYHQLIWTDGVQHKYVEESGTMNVFFRIGDALITPETDGTILHGITRDSIIQIARREGIDMQVRKVEVEEVAKALRAGTLTEAFGAGTAATIAHIKTIAHDGVDYDLPPISPKNWSNHVGGLLDDIRRGRSEDPFGWMHRVA